MHTPLSERHAGMYGLAHHAACYDRVAGRVASRIYRRVAADVAALALPAGARVLDVGTGPGRLPRLLADTCPGLVVEGVDLSPEMVEHARAAAAGLPVTYAVADVAHLPHADASVDVVVSSLSLHHWADREAGLREVARVLKPGGRAWIYDVTGVLKRTAPAAAGSGWRLERRRRFGLIARLVIDAPITD
jgi:ubiquinone/menaquinone biosynthesis C-methylase UbiE